MLPVGETVILIKVSICFLTFTSLLELGRPCDYWPIDYGQKWYVLVLHRNIDKLEFD